jgi:hypothetical protein
MGSEYKEWAVERLQGYHTTKLQEYTYPYEYYAAGPSRVTAEDGIHRCIHCDTSGVEETYTYCPNCGAIACDSHIKTERLEGESVCTGCAVTERFALKTKYFHDESNTTRQPGSTHHSLNTYPGIPPICRCQPTRPDPPQARSCQTSTRGYTYLTPMWRRVRPCMR